MKLFRDLMRSIYMNKTTMIAGMFGVVFLLTVAAPVDASVFDNFRNGFKKVEDRRDDRQERREDFKEDFREKMATRPAFVRALKKIRIVFGSGRITAINGTTFTVEKDDKTFTVLTSTFDGCTTVFRRRFWGNSSLTEYSVGNFVNVTGRFQDEAKTIIEACVVRNISIQKRFGAFVGEVLSLTSSGWVMSTVSDKRTNQTVTVSSNTKFNSRKEETIIQGDIQVGHRIRVKGMWNRTDNTITEVTSVKDYSLPLK